ncbi:MAG: chemotaxis protein CheW [Gammaproteobacteria bacterium]|nr:chemotaxis protein CheW [Gammaproteobacteria bacterium]
MAEQSAYQLLSDMRQQAIDFAARNITITTQSAGVKNIAYVVNGVHFFSNAQDIREISVCENLTRIPQTKPWLRGLVNSKGVLYSVTDLSLLAGFGRQTPEKKGHLLLLNDPDLQSAFLVNRVIGFRYFDDAERIENLETKQDTLDGLSTFVVSGCHLDGQDWFELAIPALMESEQFREVQ